MYILFYLDHIIYREETMTPTEKSLTYVRRRRRRRRCETWLWYVNKYYVYIKIYIYTNVCIYNIIKPHSLKIWPKKYTHAHKFAYHFVFRTRARAPIVKDHHTPHFRNVSAEKDRKREYHTLYRYLSIFYFFI